MADYTDFELSLVDGIGNAVLAFGDSDVVYQQQDWNDLVLLDMGIIALQPLRYTHRVFDTVAGSFIYWTYPTVDSSGENYPGPGTFGVNTSDFTVLYVE